MNTRVFLKQCAGYLFLIMVSMALGVLPALAADLISEQSSSEAEQAVTTADLEFPPAPVLTTPAGVLPTSPLAALDAFDEFVGRTLFTFGIPALRTQALARQAAERIAELQLLDAQGIRTNAITGQNLEAASRLLDRATRLTLERFVHGGRPFADLSLLVRTIVASGDAVLDLSADAVEDFDETAVVAEQDGSPLFLERQFVQTLWTYENAIPDDIVQSVMTELVAAATRRGVLQTDAYIPSPSSGIVALRRAADARLQRAQSHLAAGRPRDAFPILHELTIAHELLKTPIASLVVQHETEQILDAWQTEGNITAEERRQIERMIRSEELQEEYRGDDPASDERR